MENETERIVHALCEIEGLASVTRGWPKREAALPCVAVALAGEKGAEERDDAEYLTELTYYVRLFARNAAQLDGLKAKVRGCMEELGYRREFAFESADEQAHVRTERYQTVI